MFITIANYTCITNEQMQSHSIYCAVDYFTILYKKKLFLVLFSTLNSVVRRVTVCCNIFHFCPALSCSVKGYSSQRRPDFFANFACLQNQTRCCSRVLRMFFHFFFFKHIVTIGLKLYFLLLPFPDMYVHVIVRKTSNKKGGVVVQGGTVVQAGVAVYWLESLPLDRPGSNLGPGRPHSVV